MQEGLRARSAAIKQAVKEKRSLSGWKLPKQTTAFAPEGTWTNADCDVTPESQRTWTSLTIFGYWFSDILSAQSWQSASSVLAIGLTWREALFALIVSTFMIGVPIALNGAIGATLHIPFPVAARSSFGFIFSRFAVVVRLVTALFWHSIQTYTGSTAITQVIRAIWPSYLQIPNKLPESAGITTQELLSHFIFWSIQFPFLMIRPHKLRWFFLFKAVLVSCTALATVIGMTVKAGGAGDIWDQQATVHGSERYWLLLSCMMSIGGAWSTMGTNIPDFTRYLKQSKGTYWQALFFPLIATSIGVLGIIGTSAAKVVYGEYIWNPLELAAQWTGPGGRAAAFFVGLAWTVAQIGVNISANVISCSNDMTSLCPKYINIRRGAIITTVIGGWVMVPWKIVYSATSLLSFMAAMSVFLAPICGLLTADFWLVKKHAIDIPALYKPHARYEYFHGFNWRAIVAMLVATSLNLPGMVTAVNPSYEVGLIQHVYDINFLYGYISSIVVYTSLSWAFPAVESLVPCTIHEEVDGIEDGVEAALALEQKGFSAHVKDESHFKQTGHSIEYIIQRSSLE